eukprot:scaffold6770_cov125-Isochrysis_galbana.AAC.3
MTAAHPVGCVFIAHPKLHQTCTGALGVPAQKFSAHATKIKSASDSCNAHRLHCISNVIRAQFQLKDGFFPSRAARPFGAGIPGVGRPVREGSADEWSGSALRWIAVHAEAAATFTRASPAARCVAACFAFPDLEALLAFVSIFLKNGAFLRMSGSTMKFTCEPRRNTL